MNSRSQGWVVFAAIVLFTAGVMRVFDAIWAFRYSGALPNNLEDALFGRSLNTYGWIYIVVAAVLIVSAVLVLGGSQVARWIGVAAGVIGAISAIWWMPYYPVWSLTYVGIGALVVYALTAHGGRAEPAYPESAYPPARGSSPTAGPAVRS
ncbi:MAG: hypothetical protein ACM3ML_00160 [Micromonosporaceae bacterium]